MLTLSLSGEDDLQSRLGQLPAALVDGLASKMSALVDALVEKVTLEKLSGGVLNVRSGALRASIVGGVTSGPDGVSASVASAGDLKYAAIQEYGGKTAAHEILAVKAGALAFVAGGALRFAKRVEHPGSTIPERSYLRSSLAEMTDEIIAALAAAPSEAWEES